MKYAEGLDPEKNPSPYGALSEPEPEEVERILAESGEIHACFTTDWMPLWMLAGRNSNAAALERSLAAAKPIRAARNAALRKRIEG
jgi:hypothetical protein